MNRWQQQTDFAFRFASKSLIFRASICFMTEDLNGQVFLLCFYIRNFIILRKTKIFLTFWQIFCCWMIMFASEWWGCWWSASVFARDTFKAPFVQEWLATGLNNPPANLNHFPPLTGESLYSQIQIHIMLPNAAKDTTRCQNTKLIRRRGCHGDKWVWFLKRNSI